MQTLRAGRRTSTGGQALLTTLTVTCQKYWRWWRTGRDGGDCLQQHPSCINPHPHPHPSTFQVKGLWVSELIKSLCHLFPQVGRQWYEDICLMEFISSYDHCLLVWVNGEGASIMESLPVSEVKDVTHELLVLFLGIPDLPPPSRLVRWVSVEANPEDTSLLGQLFWGCTKTINFESKKPH